MINFDSKLAIYVQIADFMSEQILSRKWAESERIPSVREVAALVQVNPNTVMRSFSLLQEQAIIFNKRGVGYFVADNAIILVNQARKITFLEEKLPKIFYEASLLDFTPEELTNAYLAFLSLSSSNSLEEQ